MLRGPGQSTNKKFEFWKNENFEPTKWSRIVGKLMGYFLMQ